MHQYHFITSIHSLHMLFLIEPPQLILAPENGRKPMARTTRFYCEFSGWPTPNITWLKNGREIEHNGRIKVQGERLIISQTDTRDSGYYQCRAENEAGMAQGIARLYIIPSGKHLKKGSNYISIPLGEHCFQNINFTK